MLRMIWKATKFLIATVLIFGLFGGIYAWQFNILPELIRAGVASAPPPTETVSAETVKVEQWPSYVRAIGTVVAVNGVDISPQVGGIVREVRFESGQEVGKGDVLIEITSETERADLTSLQATLKNATRDLDRKDELARKGFGAKADRDSSLAKRDETLAAIAKTEALIAQKTIYAPFAGRLGMRRVDVGQYVGPGTPIVWLQTVDPVYVDFPVPEQDYGRLRVGQRVDATLDAYPDQSFAGKIASIDAKVAADSRTVTVRASFPNAERKLVPGMFANVAVTVGEPADVLTLPRTAITYSLYGDSVFVVGPVKSDPAKTEPAKSSEPAEPAKMVERRFVKVGEARDGRVVVASGLKPGEVVVTTGQLKLRPGTPVRIDNTVALEVSGERRPE